MNDNDATLAAMVEKKARRLFSPQELPQAMALLQEYGAHSWEREHERVRLAMLKLSGGKLEALRACLQTAQQDYRDILAGAEYPNQMSCDSWKLPPQERRKLAKQDDEQYLRWLHDES